MEPFNTSRALMTAFNLVTGASKNSHWNWLNSAESSLGSRFGSASAKAHTNSAVEPNRRFVEGSFPLEDATFDRFSGILKLKLAGKSNIYCNMRNTEPLGNCDKEYRDKLLIVAVSAYKN